MMEIDRSLLSKLEHGKNMSTQKLTAITAYYLAFIEGNSTIKVDYEEVLRKTIAQTSSFF
ncbi:hypothetical protein [Bacteroides fragilis]|uniref:hypothetical protein n=1 Tax=Bacteroides fragilis TaxID=817 RepID=UPI001C706A65|nr:hypothetical protein [Bacteroides fragilis]MBW9276418.1 hypothetical protein [Bacteroides fragilis]